ncbi:MAG: hypothetical protein ISS67_06780 [Desulfobacterales bacterium]|uniref:Uncharacterized protein n=1 Tax=Candidatus Desulfaltia bathyphila TaxID=2841697 RepID=A0A8J6N6F6_9BACT|nr:hypothetical protein [Candidatus Desulfaltia bathyphila]MBL7208205.1 hypothetical protein [Desulfobacterales bacterium]
MKPEQLYQNLIEIAEKLNVKVSEKNFRKTGKYIQSGLCRVKNENLFMIDKHLPVSKKNIILAELLNKMPLENIYIMPVVRDFVNKHRKTEREESFADSNGS